MHGRLSVPGPCTAFAVSVPVRLNRRFHASPDTLGTAPPCTGGSEGLRALPTASGRRLGVPAMAASERKTRIACAKKELQALKAQLQALVASRSTTNLAKAAASAGVSKEGLPRLHDRKRLFGHYGKVYAMSWAGNSKHMVSARCVSAGRRDRSVPAGAGTFHRPGVAWQRKEAASTLCSVVPRLCTVRMASSWCGMLSCRRERQVGASAGPATRAAEEAGVTRWAAKRDTARSPPRPLLQPST